MKKLVLSFALGTLLTLSACTSSNAKPTDTIVNEVSSSQEAEPKPTYETQANRDSYYPTLNPDRNYLIIVNQETDVQGNFIHRYDFGGDYDQALQKDLIYLADAVSGEPTPLEKATALAFTQLSQDMFLKGMPIGLYSGYRTEADQKAVAEYYNKLDGWKDENTIVESGFSEHHTGLNASIVVWYKENGKEPVWYTETASRSNADFDILHNTLADYGFILRYPQDKELFTGVKYEPYEIRFVGSSKTAHEIMDNHLCLEEYVAMTSARGYSD